MSEYRLLPSAFAGADHAKDQPFDMHQRLLEAGAVGVCPEGDLLALMPSVQAGDVPWVDGTSWLRRMLGF